MPRLAGLAAYRSKLIKNKVHAYHSLGVNPHMDMTDSHSKCYKNGFTIMKIDITSMALFKATPNKFSTFARVLTKRFKCIFFQVYSILKVTFLY